MMDREKLAAVLVRMASDLLSGGMSRTASDSLIDLVIDQREFVKLEKVADEQTWKLATDVYFALKKAMTLTRDQKEALNRLRGVIGTSSEANIRNQIFKAAHALGMRLPSSSF